MAQRGNVRRDGVRDALERLIDRTHVAAPSPRLYLVPTPFCFHSAELSRPQRGLAGLGQVERRADASENQDAWRASSMSLIKLCSVRVGSGFIARRFEPR